MKSFILKYNGDGVTPAATFADPANGFQFPNASTGTPDLADRELKEAVQHWASQHAHPDSGLANIHITVTVENTGPNAGDDSDGGE